MAQTERSSYREVRTLRYRAAWALTHSVFSFKSNSNFSALDIGQPYSLDVFEGHVYWTTKEKGEVWKTNKFGKGNKVKVITINPWLTQVRIYQEHRHNHSGQNTERLK